MLLTIGAERFSKGVQLHVVRFKIYAGKTREKRHVYFSLKLQ